MTTEEDIIMEQARAQIAQANSTVNLQQGQATVQSAIMEEQEKSMVLDQLDLSEELSRIEHLLRGHIIKRNETTGEEYWDDVERDDCPPSLNEYGVRVIMKFVSFYLNKNKLLSNYSEEMIPQKMEDFSTELADLIFMKYREMGLDTPDKRKMYSVIVREIQDAVHDTYLRALGGKERDSLRKHWQITENMGNPVGNQNQNRGGFFKR